jgi:hypothetical protein
MAGKTNIPAHIIAARGQKITLLDGSTPTLVYGFSSIMRLEEEFGSVSAALEAVTGPDGESPSLIAVAKVMCAGLEHESTDNGLLSDLDTLRHLLDSTEIEAYSEAIGAAFSAAFPQAAPEDGEGSEADPTTASRGPSGTTSAPSSSDAQSGSSGA